MVYINGIKASQKDLTAFWKYISEHAGARYDIHTTKSGALAIVTYF